MSGARVYVGNLPYGVKERDIEHFFRGFGRLREILMKGPYGFVEFEDQRDADDAVYELDGKRIFGERVTVERARGIPRDRNDPYHRNSRQSRSRYERSVPPYTRTEHRIIVENLSSRCSWQDLKDYLRKAGEVTYADAHRPYLREGIVEFASYSDMKNAIEKLDDTELYGRRIRLIEDRPKRSRRSSRSRSKSRSASKSRSRSRSRRRSASRSRSRSRSKRSRRHSKSRSKSKSPVEKSKSRSRSESKARSRTKSKSKVRSRTKSPRRTKTRSRSKSKSVERSSRSKSRARSKTDDRSKSRSRSKSASRSKSRSRSVSRDRSKSRSRSKSRDRSVSRSRSKSRSQSK